MYFVFSCWVGSQEKKKNLHPLLKKTSLMGSCTIYGLQSRGSVIVQSLLLAKDKSDAKTDMGRSASGRTVLTANLE